MSTFIRSPTTAMRLAGLKSSSQRNLQERTLEESTLDLYKSASSTKFQRDGSVSPSVDSAAPSESQGSAAQGDRTVVVAEFLHNLFPGQSIFTKKRNAFDIISANHDYSRMFAPSLIRSRTVRFIRSTTYLLVCVFIDTIFYSLYYPSNSICNQMVDKVWNVQSRVPSFIHLYFRTPVLFLCE